MNTDNRSETYYHGTRNILAIYAGICLTTSERSAGTYGAISESTIDLDGLVVRSIAGYDRNANTAAGDRAAEIAALVAEGVDAITYDDEDEMGRQHDCLRLLSDRALARLAWID